MANAEHLSLLKKRVQEWNDWRKANPEIRPDISGADLRGMDLHEAYLRQVDFYKADLRGTDFQRADLGEAFLSHVRLDGAHLNGAKLYKAVLVESSLMGTDLRGAHIYGASVWNVQLDKQSRQEGLAITRSKETTIPVDGLEIAQFIYLLLNNPNIRKVIDTLTSKTVLILGRFATERKKVLDALRDRLREFDLLSIIFDFDRPIDRNLTETIRTLAGISYCVIADLTHTSIPGAAMACGDSRGAAHAYRRRFMVAALGWVALVTGLAWAGVLRRWDLRPPPLMGMFAGILVLGPVLARSTIGDRLARGLPLAALVGLQSFRFPLEVVMHAAAERGIMLIQMSYSGRNFDIVTGITAVVLAAWLRFGRPPRAIVWAWNVLGLLLRVNIVTVAALSTPMFAAFGSTPDRLNTFVASPPFVLLPAVLVLTAWAGHLIVYRALSGQESGTRG